VGGYAEEIFPFSYYRSLIVSETLYLHTVTKLLPITEWQNYLRTQAGNTTTVNVVICTVDYLLRLQVSKRV
jgi:hypothetical protein